MLKIAPDTSGEEKTHRVALVGNVRVGKSVLFEQLCTINQKNGELPTGLLRRPLDGTELHACRGCTKQRCDDESPSTQLLTEVVDVPGSTSIFVGGNGNSAALKELLLEGQLHGVLVVLDAKNLRRSLALALEVAEFGLPVLLDLNMVDEAERLGIQVDDAELARAFEVPVNRTVAIDGVGIRRLRDLLFDARVPKRTTPFPQKIEQALQRMAELLPDDPIASRAMGLLLLARDESASAWAKEHLDAETNASLRSIVAETARAFGSSLRVIVSSAIHAEADRIASGLVFKSKKKRTLLDRFGRAAQRPLAGTLIALLVLSVAYLWVGAFAATFVVDSIDAYLFRDLLIPLFESIVAYIPSEFVRAAIIDPDFGLLPTGLFLAVGIVLPVLFAFYLLHAVLEDAGYLPRLAVLFDRIFRRMGLNGQALIPLVLGFSCITMAVITTRTLVTRKERIILTFLLCMGIPCAPLLAVMIVLLAQLSLAASVVVFGVIGLQIFVAGLLASRVLEGKLSDLILEIPPMRVPKVRRVFLQTWRRTMEFMREAVPIFLLASFVVFLFHRLGGLDLFEVAARPLTQSVLGLPDQAVQVFIKTAIRRESGATELKLLSGHFDSVQLVVALVVMTFIVPCVNAAFVIFKERGVKIGVAILATASAWALVIGGLLNLVLRSLGVTFA